MKLIRVAAICPVASVLMGLSCDEDGKVGYKVIAYLRTANGVLREQLRTRAGRIGFTDRQRRRLAATAKALGRTALKKLDTIVTPETLLRWQRQLIARKYDGSRRRRVGRPGVMQEIERLIVVMARDNSDRSIASRERLGGLLRYYYREAA